MPSRVVPLITGQYYHVYNRGVNRTPIFTDSSDYQRLLKTLDYYRFVSPPTKLSQFLIFSQAHKRAYFSKALQKQERHISILAYCLMPNHFHLLVKQEQDMGITEYLRKSQNSFAKYTNIKHKRTGGMFEGPFRAVRIESDEQLIHVSRYIYLNPYSSNLTPSISSLLSYPWSSLQQYLKGELGICDTTKILSFFPSIQAYKTFLLDQADYQRQLENVKHLLLEAQE